MCLFLSPLAAAQMPGMSPSRDLEVEDRGASQLDKIGAMVDRELEFRDERDYPYKLQQLFPGKQPVVLMLGYYSCPSMCGQPRAQCGEVSRLPPGVWNKTIRLRRAGSLRVGRSWCASGRPALHFIFCAATSGAGQ